MKGFFYISSFVPKQDADEFHKNMVTGANISASVFSYSLLSGFSSIVPADGMKVLTASWSISFSLSKAIFSDTYDE